MSETVRSSPRPGRPTNASPVLDEIGVLFANYEFGEENTLPPDAVREALANAYNTTTTTSSTKFQLETMDDACEVFEAILRELHGGVDLDEPCRVAPGSDKCLGHKIFALELIESTNCTVPSCHASSGVDASSCEFVYRVWANELARVATRASEAGGRVRLDQAIALSLRAGKPNAPCPVRCRGDAPVGERVTTVLAPPAALCMSVVWTADVPQEELRTVVDLLDPDRTFELKNVFAVTTSTGSSSYALMGFVGFYGSHYMYYRRTRRMERNADGDIVGNEWIQLDDESVKPLGPWADVSEKIVRGRIRPVLLFFARIPDEWFAAAVPVHRSSSSVAPLSSSGWGLGGSGGGEGRTIRR